MTPRFIYSFCHSQGLFTLPRWWKQLLKHLKHQSQLTVQTLSSSASAKTWIPWPGFSQSWPFSDSRSKTFLGRINARIRRCLSFCHVSQLLILINSRLLIWVWVRLRQTIDLISPSLPSCPYTHSNVIGVFMSFFCCLWNFLVNNEGRVFECLFFTLNFITTEW